MGEQYLWLFGLAMPVACVAWTVTHEDLFREPREWLHERCHTAACWWGRKFFYMWTCEYCLSHYVAAAFVALTNFHFLLPDWRGWLLSWLSLVGVANVYLSAYSRLRVEINKGRTELKKVESDQNGAARREPARAR